MSEEFRWSQVPDEERWKVWWGVAWRNAFVSFVVAVAVFVVAVFFGGVRFG